MREERMNFMRGPNTRCTEAFLLLENGGRLPLCCVVMMFCIFAHGVAIGEPAVTLGEIGGLAVPKRVLVINGSIHVQPLVRCLPNCFDLRTGVKQIHSGSQPEFLP